MATARLAQGPAPESLHRNGSEQVQQGRLQRAGLRSITPAVQTIDCTWTLDFPIERCLENAPPLHLAEREVGDGADKVISERGAAR